MQAINHILPNYAKVIIWAINHGIALTKADQERKRGILNRREEMKEGGSLADLLDIGWLVQDKQKQFEKHHTSITHKKMEME